MHAITIRPRPKHLFKDINSFWDPAYNVSSKWSLKTFEKAIENGSPIKTSAWCVICNKFCKNNQVLVTHRWDASPGLVCSRKP